MNLIPQRLFNNPGVKIIFRDGNTCILTKELDCPVLRKQGYITNHVISHVISGQQKIETYDGDIITVSAGQSLFIARGLYHITDLLPDNGSFKSILFYFDDDIIHEFLSKTKITQIDHTNSHSYLPFSKKKIINNFFESLLNLYTPNSVNNKNILGLKILELLYILNDLVTESRFASFLFSLTTPKKRNIKVFMEANFDKPLKIEDYAYLTGRSLSSFRRDFKSNFNLTPQKWLKKRRMEKALSLIHKKDYSVTELAYEIGYENISYFIKEFKNEYGLSPKQYALSIDRGIA